MRPGGEPGERRGGDHVKRSALGNVLRGPVDAVEQVGATRAGIVTVGAEHEAVDQDRRVLAEQLGQFDPLRPVVGADALEHKVFGQLAAGRQGAAELSTGGQLLFTEAFYTGPDKQPLNESLKPDLLVDERSRTYLEKDTPMTELILRRGVRRLLGEDTASEAKPA